MSTIYNDYFQVWYNPGGRINLAMPGESSIAEWRAKTLNDRWRDYTRLAWEISPVLAVYLPVRLRKSDNIVKEVCHLVRLKPTSVIHVPEALQYLVTTDTLLNDSPEVLTEDEPSSGAKCLCDGRTCPRE